MTTSTPAVAVPQWVLKATEELNFLLAQIEKQVHGIQQNPTYLQLKDSVGEHLVEWQKSLSRVRAQISQFPNELGHNEFIHNLKQRLETCEISVRSFRKSLEIEGRKLLASRTHLQWGRKLFHTANGLFGLWLYAYSGLSKPAVILILTFFFSTAVITEIVRRIWPQTNDKICNALTGIMRERERTKISSATWYMGAILVVFLICPRDVSILTLFYVAVGDTVAGIVGVQYGRHRISPHVSLEGFLAAFTVCFLGTLFFTAYGLPVYHLAGIKLFFFSLLASWVAALSEGAFKKWDDNLIIPLFSAPALWLLMKIF